MVNDKSKNRKGPAMASTTYTLFTADGVVHSVTADNKNEARLKALQYALSKLEQGKAVRCKVDGQEWVWTVENAPVVAAGIRAALEAKKAPTMKARKKAAATSTILEKVHPIRRVERNVRGNVVGYEGFERVTTFETGADAEPWLAETMSAEQAAEKIARVGRW